MTYYPRASRDFDFVPSSGSSVLVKQYNAIGELVSGPGVILDIHTGFIRELYHNENTTHTGSNGADLHSRVGSGWLFALVTSFPSTFSLVTVENVQAGGEVSPPFVQTLLGSSRSVSLQFNLGDPLFWDNKGDGGIPRRSFRGAKALLGEVETRIDARTKKVIGLNIAGVGNSLLWTYLQTGDGAAVPIHPGVWL